MNQTATIATTESAAVQTTTTLETVSVDSLIPVTLTCPACKEKTTISILDLKKGYKFYPCSNCDEDLELDGVTTPSSTISFDSSIIPLSIVPLAVAKPLKSLRPVKSIKAGILLAPKVTTKFTGSLNSATWAIRKGAAKHWECKIKEISWAICLSMAKSGITEFKTPKEDNQTTHGKPISSGKRSRAANNGEYILYMESCIESGGYTKKLLVKSTHRQFPDLKKSTISATVSNGSNEKYNRFSSLVIRDSKTKKLHF